MEVPNLYISESEILSTAKKIRKQEVAVNNVTSEMQHIIMTSLTDAIKDESISLQLNDIASTIKDIGAEYTNCSNELIANIILYANQINDLDKFECSSEYDSLLNSAVKLITSIFD